MHQYAQQPIPEDSIHHILNVGLRAQSAKNTQPWHFIAIREPYTLEALSNLGTYAGHLNGADLGLAKLTPDPSQCYSIMFDAGQAAAYMQLAAWEMGVGSCLATIYEPEAARELLEFPQDLHLNVAISLDYPADPEILSAPSKAGGRRSFSEIVHFERG
jgi:nitroreductase